MIPGNLDLTENLDFRAVSKPIKSVKSVSLIPWSTDQNKASLKDRTVWQTSYQYNNTTQINYSILIENVDQLGLEYDWDELNQYRTTYSINSISDQYTISWNNSSTLSYIDYSTNHLNGYITAGDDSFNLSQITNVHTSRVDTTDDRIPWAKLINDNDWTSYHSIIPWYTGSIRRSKQKRIPWDVPREDRYHPFFDFANILIEDLIPWMSKINNNGKNRYKILTDEPYKDYIRNRIPWLTNLSGYEFDAHIDELFDRDQLSYLTNLAHLGIHDTELQSSNIENINDILISI